MVAADYMLAVSFETWDRTDHRTGRDDNVLRLDRLLLAFSVSDFNFSGQSEFAGSFEYRDFVFLHQVFNAFGILQYDFVFAFLNVGKGELNSRRLHAEVSCVLHLFVDVGGHQHLLRGNAATQSAGATEACIFLNNGGFQTELPGANGGYVTAGTAADNRYIKLFVGQFIEVPLVICGDAQPHHGSGARRD